MLERQDGVIYAVALVALVWLALVGAGSLTEAHAKTPIEQSKAVFGENRLVAGVHQQKSTGAVSAFGITGLEAGLTKESSLLVAGGT